MALLVLAVVTFAVIGCTGAGGPIYGGTGYLGTWQMSNSSYTETVVWNPTTFSVTDTGSDVGTMICSVDSVNTGNGHIQITTTATSGIYAGLDGVVWYILYTVSGDTMKMGMGLSGYPTTCDLGPYTRQ